MAQTRSPVATTIVYNLTGQLDFTIPFEYLARKYVELTLLGNTRKPLVMNTDYRFVSKTVVSLNANPSAGFPQLEIRRNTSATERLVDFHDGSVLRANDLNISQMQALHVAEEARSNVSDAISVDDNGNLDARNRKVVNLRGGTDPLDAVSYGQLRAFDTSTGSNADRAEAAAASITTNAGTGIAFPKFFTNAIARSIGSIVSDSINIRDFGAVGDGVTDDTASINAALSEGRRTGTKVYAPGGIFKVNGTLDISGVTFEGTVGGYNTATVGTTLSGAGANTVLEQLDTTLPGLTYNVRNFRIINSGAGLKLRYGVHCDIANITITDSVLGLVVGDEAFVGCLFTTFSNIRAEVTDTALIMRGSSWCNANTFNTSLFKGNLKAADIHVKGGYGAINNVFNNVEFTGPAKGIVMGNVAGMSMYSCYFESKDCSIETDGAVTDLLLDHCVYGSVRNDLSSGGIYIWHNTDTYSLDVKVNGGKLFSDENQPHYKNLKFIDSVAVNRLTVSMLDQPNLTGISTNNLSLLPVAAIKRGSQVSINASFTPVVTASNVEILGNSTATGSYVVYGNTVEVTIEITLGSTVNLSQSGDWIFRMPFRTNSRANDVSARIVDAGTRNYVCGGQITAGNSSLVLFDTMSGNTVSRLVPMTFAVGDSIQITARYTLGATSAAALIRPSGRPVDWSKEP